MRCSQNRLFVLLGMCVSCWVCECACECGSARGFMCMFWYICIWSHIFCSMLYVCVHIRLSECHTLIRCGSRGCCMIVYLDDLPCIILHVSDRRLDHLCEIFQGTNGNNRATIPQRLVNKKWRGGKICKSVRNVNFLLRITPCTQYRKLAMTLHLAWPSRNSEEPDNLAGCTTQVQSVVTD